MVLTHLYWKTIDMIELYSLIKWIIDNKKIQWYANFHCIVFIVLQRYNELDKQAVVIY